MTGAAVVAEIRALARDVDSGSLAADKIGEAVARVRIVARITTSVDRAELGAALGELEAAVVRQMEVVGAQLRQMGNTRSAIAAYGSLRPHCKAQRLRTRV
ncbi:MAG: hypothetical protein ABMB14_29695 [Myxococcota bacterium]